MLRITFIISSACWKGKQANPIGTCSACAAFKLLQKNEMLWIENGQTLEQRVERGHEISILNNVKLVG